MIYCELYIWETNTHHYQRHHIQMDHICIKKIPGTLWIISPGNFFFFLMSVQTLAFSPWEGQEEPVEHMLMIAGQDDCHWAVLSKRFIPKESLTQGEPPAGILALLQLQPNHWWSCTQCQWWVLPHWRGDHTAQTNPGGFRPCLCSVGGSSAPAWCGK